MRLVYPKKIYNGYVDNVYYVGDYLGKISDIGTVTTAINNVEKLITQLK